MDTPDRAGPRPSWIFRGALVLILAYALFVLAMMWWWDTEPDHFDPIKATQARATARQQPVVVGSATTSALIDTIQVMLDKRGGYLSNDKLPPGLLMDNIPNWEFGVVTASRDLTRALRNEFSRSQTQSVEDKDLQEAEPLISSPNDRWLLPSSESQYRKAIERIDSYATRLADNDTDDAQFYARADNLVDFLSVVSTRLGSLSQRLSASVGQMRIDTDLANDPNAQQSKPTASSRVVKTPWTKIDDNFYEARGYTWALREQLEAIRVDFGPVLRDKNAMVSLDQVVREIEEAQKPLGSPIVLNGSPFGFFGNHSLVLANYISRANAALIELRELLRRG
ncbi:DUF2333 family protein [Dokdonella immobilis]|uniref:DUF2333 domain-containing protein n=1 Tax=Dokdonella immobilis TaxID=578942 RepID=A0A1I4W8M2_9GAMM|nr:DUF2333 family protein [Dokdonella immobilis]SFN09805.1 hypothetical protein SAMN05216289_10482 [Dokdonella immobilis]